MISVPFTTYEDIVKMLVDTNCPAHLPNAMFHLEDGSGVVARDVDLSLMGGELIGNLGLTYFRAPEYVHIHIGTLTCRSDSRILSEQWTHHDLVLMSTLSHHALWLRELQLTGRFSLVESSEILIGQGVTYQGIL